MQTVIVAAVDSEPLRLQLKDAERDSMSHFSTPLLPKVSLSDSDNNGGKTGKLAK